MSSYDIWSTTIRVSDMTHVATICAVPMNGSRGEVHSHTRILATAGDARMECSRMAVGMQETLIAEGHEIRRVSDLRRR